MTADVVDTAAIRAAYVAVTGHTDRALMRTATDVLVLDLCSALDLARDRNAELMNDRTEALNGEALQRGRAHAAESRIANALDVHAGCRCKGPCAGHACRMYRALSGPIA